ncbi:MAG: hypothetical protein Q9164_005551 [Protoblastenia rupestris]
MRLGRPFGSLVEQWIPDSTLRRSGLSQHAVPDVFQLPLLQSLDLYEVTVRELQQHFANGDLTSVEYVGYCLERIQNINPYLEAIIEVNPDAIQLAAKLDEERRHGKIRGMLHGIPVLVKDMGQVQALPSQYLQTSSLCLSVPRLTPRSLGQPPLMALLA